MSVTNTILPRGCGAINVEGLQGEIIQTNYGEATVVRDADLTHDEAAQTALLQQTAQTICVNCTLRGLNCAGRFGILPQGTNLIPVIVSINPDRL